MNKLSRRALAVWAVEQLRSGKTADLVINQLAAVLISSRREDQARMLADDVAFQLEVSGELSSATVTSRYPLDEQIRNNLVQSISAANNTKQTTIDEQLDESVLGGIRVKTATRSWDLTVANQLNELRKVL